MEEITFKGESVWIAGTQPIAYSLLVCFVQGGHRVKLLTPEPEAAGAAIQRHHRELTARGRKGCGAGSYEILEALPEKDGGKLAFILTGEDLSEKRALIGQLENCLPATATIAVNTESIPLSELQAGALNPARVIGANWVEPAHTTCFLELITNSDSDPAIASALMQLARTRWNKDPYLVARDVGIRAKMFAAMVREAFYLVQNGYASIEDIDRACRNDAGYYLPFAGNFRYMDLMGTYAYGMVMKELNPELSNETIPPPFFEEILARGGKGMESREGFYHYQEGEVDRWKQRIHAFSYQIEEIIRKYPFNYQKQRS